MLNDYKNLINRHQQEFNNFPMFFAFNDNQFEEAMSKLGLKPEDTNQVYSFSSLGGIYKRTDSLKLKELLHKHNKEFQDAIDNDTTGEGFISQMFLCEMINHEYLYTRDIYDVLNALGLTLSDIATNDNLRNGFNIAFDILLEMEECDCNDLQ